MRQGQDAGSVARISVARCEYRGAHLRRRERRPAPRSGHDPQPVLPAGVLVVRQELRADVVVFRKYWQQQALRKLGQASVADVPFVMFEAERGCR